MEITIIGWYGTETIGDRAILAGIFKIISECSSSYKIRLGSLYPFYTERTVYEDIAFYKEISSNKMSEFVVFDSRDPQALRHNIKKSDLLMVGGGPLMDLTEMNMLEYSFSVAKKNSIKSLLFGCGWGPLKKQKTIEIATRLVELADMVVFRDSDSKKQCLNFCSRFANKIESSLDPAFFTCDFFVKNKKEPRRESHIAINFRDVSVEKDQYYEGMSLDDIFFKLVKNISGKTNLPIHLVPMHNFFIGGDDRCFLNKIEKGLNIKKVMTIHKPMNLYQTMDIYYHAKLCVGMRFHSIVLQTILNGNNYIVDYTNPNNGKIIGMIHQLDLFKFYSGRYFSIHTENDIFDIDINNKNRFIYDESMLAGYFNKYVAILQGIMKK